MKKQLHASLVTWMNGKKMQVIKMLKEKRIQAQYYLKDVFLDNELEVKKFIVNSKTILNNLNQDSIEKIRIKIKDLIG